MKKKKKAELLENLAQAQAELILIHRETLDVIDMADYATAAIEPLNIPMPHGSTPVGTDLHDLRDEHMDREEELLDEISKIWEQLDPPTQDEIQKTKLD